MGKSLKLLISAAVIVIGAGATLATTAEKSEARSRFFLGIGLPPIYLGGPPAYYYPPPAYYYPPPVYSAPPPAYAPPAPCRARYDWRWDGYQWRQAYVGCY